VEQKNRIDDTDANQARYATLTLTTR
jgi:hypothetical protein